MAKGNYGLSSPQLQGRDNFKRFIVVQPRQINLIKAQGGIKQYEAAEDEARSVKREA